MISPDGEWFLLGDIGIFPSHPYPSDFGDKVSMIRGNHDAPDLCRKHKNYLGDFGYLANKGIYFISGAWSVDYKQRIPGISWWPDEELSYEQFDTIFKEIPIYKPRIILSHDCPSGIKAELFGFDKFYRSKTCQALDRVFELYQPELWIFGHIHRGKQRKINGTHFVCLQELECCEIPDIKWES